MSCNGFHIIVLSRARGPPFGTLPHNRNGFRRRFSLSSAGRPREPVEAKIFSFSIFPVDREVYNWNDWLTLGKHCRDPGTCIVPLKHWKGIPLCFHAALTSGNAREGEKSANWNGVDSETFYERQ